MWDFNARTTRDFPSDKEIRAAASRTHDRNGSYFQVMCGRKSRRLKVAECPCAEDYRPDDGRYFTVSFLPGHVTARQLRKYVEAGIWMQDNLAPACP